VRLVGLAVALLGLGLVVAGMILIGVPEEFVGGVIAVCGIALIAAGVIVDWDHGKPA
jgi:membrane-bound ClpP family serine protease